MKYVELWWNIRIIMRMLNESQVSKMSYIDIMQNLSEVYESSKGTSNHSQ